MAKKEEFFKHKKPQEAHRETKSYLPMIMFIGLLFFLSINLVSSMEWDNKRDYNAETKTMTIKNSILGIIPTGEVANIKLLSPQHVTVNPGKDVLVAWFEIDNKNSYKNAFKEMEFYDIKNGMEKQERDFIYKYRTDKVITKEDYNRICDEIFPNGTTTGYSLSIGIKK